MTAWDVFEAVIEALDQPRNRMGGLAPDIASGEPLRKLAIELDTPGAVDRIDQAVMVMRAFLKACKAGRQPSAPRTVAELTARKE